MSYCLARNRPFFQRKFSVMSLSRCVSLQNFGRRVLVVIILVDAPGFKPRRDKTGAFQISATVRLEKMPMTNPDPFSSHLQRNSITQCQLCNYGLNIPHFKQEKNNFVMRFLFSSDLSFVYHYCSQPQLSYYILHLSREIRCPLRVITRYYNTFCSLLSIKLF